MKWRANCLHRSMAPSALAGMRGLSVLELLVGIAVGMVVVIAGLGALLAVRGVSGTVSEANALQLQASYALRIIGQQIRQVGGRMLKPAEDAMEFAVFDENPALRTLVPVQGKESVGSGEFALEVLYQNTAEKSLPLLNNKPQLQPLLRNCVGEVTDPATAPAVVSRFRLDGSNLVCAGSGTPQVLISGVQDFQVRYLLQSAAPGVEPAWRYVRADQIATAQQWQQVHAVEVCLELMGAEFIDTTGSTYTRCDHTTASRSNRMRMVFRNTFFISNRIWVNAS